MERVARLRVLRLFVLLPVLCLLLDWLPMLHVLPACGVTRRLLARQAGGLEQRLSTRHGSTGRCRTCANSTG